MTGVLNAMVASPSTAAFSITTANTGIGVGYRSSGTGSLTPASFNGITIERLETQTDPEFFTVRLAGVQSQSLIFQVVTRSFTGTWYRFVGSSATFTTPGGTASQWQWSADANGNVPDNLWANAETEPVLISR